MSIRIPPRRVSGPPVHPQTVPHRHYSVPTNSIASPINHLEYKKKYDHFVYIPTEKKLERLIAQGLRCLEPNSTDISQGPIEGNWEQASNRLRQRNIQLAPFDKSSLVNNLLALLPHIEIPIKKQDKEPSLSAKHWRDRKEISIPLLGEAPSDHMIVNEMLRKHLKGRIILIGAATWNSDETFRNLRYLFEHASPDLEIPFIANLEINPLNARLAHLTANELGLTSTTFMSMEGNIVDGLPHIPTAFKVHRQSIIACRLLPYLAFDEISNFLEHIEKHLSETQGYCVLSYPVVSVKEFEKPTSEFFIKYSELTEMGIFKLQVLEDRKQNLIGVSFISEHDHQESGLVKGGLYQTILFQENVVHLLTKIHRFKILEKRLNVGQDQIPREATLLTRA
jgi:hypothetical protein